MTSFTAIDKVNLLDILQVCEASEHVVEYLVKEESAEILWLFLMLYHCGRLKHRHQKTQHSSVGKHVQFNHKKQMFNT